MSATFGHKWISSYGSTPSETWLAGLVDMTPEELKTGLIACLTWEPEWPPTLPQFRNLCRPRREDAHKVFVALREPEEVKDRRREVATAAIANIREETRYIAWLKDNAGRLESDFEIDLRNIRAWMI